MNRSVFESQGMQYLFTGFCVAYILFLQFFSLNELPVVQWDESRLAVNAAEMYRSGNFLVSTYENQPDLYNTKPPLMIWLQVVSAYVFGMNELALRFPSALAGFITILFCGMMVYRKTENVYYGGLAALLLASSDGFIQLHGSITGDYDALLSLFALLSIYHHQKFLLHRSRKSLLYVCLFLSLAILCKSAAGFILIPLMIAATGLRPLRRKLLKTTLVCVLACLPFAAYCLIREAAAPGYLTAILKNDFWGRASAPLEGHHSEWYYYIVNLFSFRFNYMIWLLPPALITGFVWGSRTFRYYSLVFCVYLVLLSAAQTRIHWYDMPLLPLAAILIALFLRYLYELSDRNMVKTLLPLLICIAMVWPLFQKFNFIYQRKGLELDRTHYELSEMLRSYKGDAQALYLAAPYDAEFYFYAVSNPAIQRGQFSKLRKNDIVLHGNRYKDSLNTTYRFTTLDSTANARKVRILGKHP